MVTKFNENSAEEELIYLVTGSNGDSVPMLWDSLEEAVTMKQ